MIVLIGIAVYCIIGALCGMYMSKTMEELAKEMTQGYPEQLEKGMMIGFFIMSLVCWLPVGVYILFMTFRKQIYRIRLRRHTKIISVIEKSIEAEEDHHSFNKYQEFRESWDSVEVNGIAAEYKVKVNLINDFKDWYFNKRLERW